MNSRVAVVVVVCVGLFVAGPSHAETWQTVFEDGFNQNYDEFSGKAGWVSNYCDDPWTTQGGPGVASITDDGCDGGFCSCDYGLSFACGPFPSQANSSEAVDNILHAGDTNWTDYRYKVSFRNSDNDSMGVVFRYKDTKNFYLVYFTLESAPPNNGTSCGFNDYIGARLIRVESNSPFSPNGTSTVLAQSDVVYQQGAIHGLRVDVIGENIKVWLDETLVFDVDDGSHANGKIGLFTFDNGMDGCDDDGNKCWFDDVVVAIPVDEPAPVDTDQDGVPDVDDNCPELANAGQEDADQDTVGDACDKCPESNPDDKDNDQVCDDVDNCPEDANAAQADSDQDGVGDACDPCPNAAPDDVDQDDVCDDTDNCPGVFNPKQMDSDNDKLGDLCDDDPNGNGCPFGVKDSDADGVCDNEDNCPSVFNEDQQNKDGDFYGDVCDPCPLAYLNDSDLDGVCNNEDNCVWAPNPQQENTDGDSFGNACDKCPADPLNDEDSDGLCADADNCPTISNVSQADSDQDGVGDVCDACQATPGEDPDKDDICGADDNCPAVANTDQADSDADGVGDACDPCPEDALNDGDDDTICAPKDNCPDIFNVTQLDSDGDQVGDACDVCPKDADDDIDADEICGDTDNCPEVYNPDQLDSDGDQVGDACDSAVADPPPSDDTGTPGADAGPVDDAGHTTDTGDNPALDGGSPTITPGQSKPWQQSVTGSPGPPTVVITIPPEEAGCGCRVASTTRSFPIGGLVLVFLFAGALATMRRRTHA